MKFPTNFTLDSTLPDKVKLVNQKFSKLTCIQPIGYIGLEKRTVYLFQCDCGEYHISTPRDVKSGKVTSCGCTRQQQASITGSRNKKLKSDKISFEALYRQYKSRSEKKKMKFLLSQQEFRDITSANCHYCGAAPVRSYGGNRYTYPYVFNGIDRKDNTKGYTMDNSLPCCFTCNRAKHDLPYDTFIMWVKNLTNYTNERET